MNNILKLLRIKHWIKNVLIFIPLICSGLLNVNNLFTTIIGFFAFSFLTSFVYIINDIRDIEKDKLHERKKKRPLASGKIKIKTAIIISVLMLIISLMLTLYLNQNIFNSSLYILLVYLLLNIGYSFGLKNIAIIDVAILATGFILRIYYGASITNIEVSNWLFLTILNASLFLGFGKRRKELENNKDSRKVLKEYTEEYINKFQYLSLSLTLVFYSLWSIEQKNEYLVYTIPVLMLVFMQYCLIIEKEEEGDPTTILYKNKSLLITCLLYAVMMLILFII